MAEASARARFWHECTHYPVLGKNGGGLGGRTPFVKDAKENENALHSKSLMGPFRRLRSRGLADNK